jgi:hypothetical protein
VFGLGGSGASSAASGPAAPVRAVRSREALEESEGRFVARVSELLVASQRCVVLFFCSGLRVTSLVVVTGCVGGREGGWVGRWWKWPVRVEQHLLGTLVVVVRRAAMSICVCVWGGGG